MATNFRVNAKEISNQSVAYQLFGDFDASSACKLINILNDNVKTSCKVAIDTDGLKKSMRSVSMSFFPGCPN